MLNNIFSQQIDSINNSNIEKYKIQYMEAVEKCDHDKIISTRTNLGLAFYYAKNYADAEKHLLGAAKDARSINDVKSEINIYGYLCIVYCDDNNIEQAQRYAEEAIRIAENAKLNKELITALINCSSVMNQKRDLSSSFKYLNHALNLALEIKNKPLTGRCYLLLARQYENAGNNTKSQEYRNLYDQLEQTFKEEEILNSKTLTQKELNIAEAEVTKKERQLQILELQKQKTLDSLNRIEAINNQIILEMEIMNQKREIDLLKIQEKEAEIDRANKFKTTAIIVISIISLLVAMLIKLLRDRNKTNFQLKETNIKLEETNKKVNSQNIELSDKNIQIEFQRNELERKNNQIIDSINYASRIQKSMLPNLKSIMTKFKDSFVFFLPRDIVSGDFYWFTNVGQYTFLAVIDCVGHSVPGAFMSVVGNSLLNEIVNEKQIINPCEILTKMNLGIINILSKDINSEDETPDEGMDMTLCRFDNNSDEIVFSAANHTIWTIYNNECNEIEGDIYSIGSNFSDSIHSKFTNKTIKSIQGMSIYMFSDGYQDQFGGPLGRKFMKKNLQKLIIKNSNLSMSKQYDILSSTLEQWKKDKPQVDDILIIGVRV
ncbi:MAG: SpoIIE family protein phosphatase [Bacteroidales bacterium]|nr:SpoIIE family protein phosphatase [Bacteroidales bacterium]